MHRLFAILLICLLPLQSFAGVGMSVKMAGMEVQMSDAVQAPCHEASQPMQAASQDCCDMQGVCQVMCHLSAGLPISVEHPKLLASNHPLAVFATSFQSADLRAGFKPPLL